MWTTIQHPLAAVPAIPNNWVRSTTAFDAYSWPELVPDLDRQGDLFSLRLRFGGLRKDVPLKGSSPVERASVHATQWITRLVVIYPTIAVLTLFGIVPAWCYRWTLKGTAPLWFPLVYVVRGTFEHGLPLHLRPRELRTAALSKMIRAISLGVIAILAFKMLALPRLLGWWNQQIWTPIFDVYLIPGTLHPYHVTSGLNALLALGAFYFFFEVAPGRLEAGVYAQGRVEKAWQTYTFIRSLLSLYSIVVLVYLTWKAVEWPGFEWKWLPG